MFINKVLKRVGQPLTKVRGGPGESAPIGQCSDRDGGLDSDTTPQAGCSLGCFKGYDVN